MKLRYIVVVSLVLLACLCVGGAVVAVYNYGGTTVQSPIRPVPPQMGIDFPTIRSGRCTGGTWYRLCFTSPKIPDDRQRNNDGLDAQLVALIDVAQETIDMAIYDFDLEIVAQAMARAAGRGVRVRMVTDTDTITNDDPAIQNTLSIVKAAGITIVDDRRSGIMHNKFTVVDSKWIATGSWNYTSGDTYRLNNNLFIAANRDLAQNYSAEFEELLNREPGQTSRPALTPNPVLNIEGSTVENLFSTEDNVASRIATVVREARTDIRFLAFSFTHEAIGNAMLDRARNGVHVEGVFETTGSGTQFSRYGVLKGAGLEVYTDGSPYVLHHKVIILDDKTTIFGSFNFSDSADRSNDENLIIITNADIAQAFSEEYDRMKQLALNPPDRR